MTETWLRKLSEARMYISQIRGRPEAPSIGITSIMHISVMLGKPLGVCELPIARDVDMMLRLKVVV